MGKVMAGIAERRYTWHYIARQYERLVAEALQTSDKMSVVAEAQKVSYSQLLELGHAHLKTNFNF
jgi:hypothetical protein